MKFTIRDILWCMVVVAIGITCCLERDKRRTMTRNWVAAVNEQTKQANERDALEREVHRLKHDLNMAQRESAYQQRNSESISAQLQKEVAERIRLTREVDRLDPSRSKSEYQPSVELTGNQ